MRVVLLALITSTLVACIPQTQLVPGVKTNIERTTVVVKDPQGNVMRIEEKEQVLQEYQAREPVQLKTSTSPPIQPIKVTR